MKLTKVELTSYEENGYLVMPKIFSKSEIDELSTVTASLANKVKQFENLPGSQVVLTVRPNEDIAIKRIVWVAAAEPSLLKTGRDLRLLSIVAEILQDTEADHLINQIHYKEPHDGVSFPWHQDEQNRRLFDINWDDCGENGSFVQVITAIDTCSIHNGPLYVIPGSHKWGYLEFGKSLNTKDLQDGFLAPKGLQVTDIQCPLLMEPGDTVFMHPRLIHASFPNQSNVSRRILINGFSSPNANHRPYPGKGSAKRIYLTDGLEVDLNLRASIRELITLKKKREDNALKSDATAAITVNFH